jgi:hypothetical protein
MRDCDCSHLQITGEVRDTRCALIRTPLGVTRTPIMFPHFGHSARPAGMLSRFGVAVMVAVSFRRCSSTMAGEGQTVQRVDDVRYLSPPRVHMVRMGCPDEMGSDGLSMPGDARDS